MSSSDNVSHGESGSLDSLAEPPEHQPGAAACHSAGASGEYVTPAETDTYTDTGVGIPDRLERLWAPYRMHYIAASSTNRETSDSAAPCAHTDEGKEFTDQSAQSGSRNPFVTLPGMNDEDALIIARGERVYCVLNLYPYNSGHVLVVPYRQVANLEDLSGEESAELMEFAQAAIRVLKAVSRPKAFNVGFNLGRASGGSVSDHLHLHVVPRWVGDANFITLLDGTVVLPQLLRDTRNMLAGEWARRSDTPGVARPATPAGIPTQGGDTGC